MEEPSLPKPPRHINDILTVLDQEGHYDVNITRRLKSKALALPPGDASDEEMADFYSERARLQKQLGYMNRALQDLRTAYAYSEKADREDPELLLRLGEAEKQAGNVQKAIDLFRRSLELQSRMAAFVN